MGPLLLLKLRALRNPRKNHKNLWLHFKALPSLFDSYQMVESGKTWTREPIILFHFFLRLGSSSTSTFHFLNDILINCSISLLAETPRRMLSARNDLMSTNRWFFARTWALRFDPTCPLATGGLLGQGRSTLACCLQARLSPL